MNATLTPHAKYGLSHCELIVSPKESNEDKFLFKEENTISEVRFRMVR